MTDDEMVRLAAALTRKCQRGYLGDDLSVDELIESVVGTTVADTLLVAEGILKIKDFEA